jgi:hypothetical protein
MAAKAGISSTYRWRLGLIAVMCLGWGGYSIYDGLVAYPAHDRVVEKFKSTHETDYPAWEKFATENGLPLTDPGNPHSGFDIYAQYVMALLTLPFGICFGYSFLTSYGRWIASDEVAVTTNKGQRAPYASITTLNKDRWKSKGIATLHYNDEAGSERKIVLDDWKYDAQATKDIVKDIEAHIQPEQIVGGPPQAATPAA